MLGIPAHLRASLRLRIAVLGAVLLLVAGTSAALGAAVFNQNGPFTGCLSVKGGVIYNVAQASAPLYACAKSDKVVSFSNAQGPQPGSTERIQWNFDFQAATGYSTTVFPAGTTFTEYSGSVTGWDSVPTGCTHVSFNVLSADGQLIAANDPYPPYTYIDLTTGTPPYNFGSFSTRPSATAGAIQVAMSGSCVGGPTFPHITGSVVVDVTYPPVVIP
jgi:hypothetical protein